MESTNLYANCAGKTLASAAPELYRFQSSKVEHDFNGRCSIYGPSSWLGKLLARIIGLPGPLVERKFILETAGSNAVAGHKVQLNTKSYCFDTSDRNEFCLKKWGCFQFRFNKKLYGNVLLLDLTAMTFLGFLIQKSICPVILVEQFADEDSLHFNFSVALPKIGRLLGCTGVLDIRPLSHAKA